MSSRIKGEEEEAVVVGNVRGVSILDKGEEGTAMGGDYSSGKLEFRSVYCCHMRYLLY